MPLGAFVLWRVANVPAPQSLTHAIRRVALHTRGLCDLLQRAVGGLAGNAEDRFLRLPMSEVLQRAAATSTVDSQDDPRCSADTCDR